MNFLHTLRRGGVGEKGRWGRLLCGTEGEITWESVGIVLKTLSFWGLIQLENTATGVFGDASLFLQMKSSNKAGEMPTLHAVWELLLF